MHNLDLGLLLDEVELEVAYNVKWTMNSEHRHELKY